MKTVVALLLLCALAAGALLVPVSGETAWQHARRKGWPVAAARAFVHGAQAGSAWVARTLRGHDEAAASAPAATPAHAVRRRAARTASNTGPASPPAAPIASSTLSPASSAGPRDRIVAGPPAEQLDTRDRAALDKLITARGGR
jgi:hypothetical protein